MKKQKLFEESILSPIGVATAIGVDLVAGDGIIAKNYGMSSSWNTSDWVDLNGKIVHIQMTSSTSTGTQTYIDGVYHPSVVSAKIPPI